ncbi:uncharacterized protein [Zea mays]|uniref:uncharacterized protein n=1 Tax=Zea mays TaxID=4577 RepID=UPI0009AAD05E|nr:uncharacterized protein LOC109940916 [Zea mays]|eukprot:XP_020396883.1 uncharacterized protein LOC109940916 [Zea mays]
MPGSNDVPPGLGPPTTSTIATTIDARATAIGPISQADFMAFQQLMVQQFAALTAAINGMSSKTLQPPSPSASATTSAATFPYDMSGYGGYPLPTTATPSTTTTIVPFPSATTPLPSPISVLVPPASTMFVPIHQIAFPHSPSPIHSFLEDALPAHHHPTVGAVRYSGTGYPK